MGSVTTAPKVTNRMAPKPSFWSRYAREILGVALLALAIHDIFGAHGFLAMRRTQRELKELRTDLTRLNQENSELGGQVQSLKSDPKSIERIAREEMGLAKPGEMIFKIPNQSDDQTSPNPAK